MTLFFARLFIAVLGLTQIRFAIATIGITFPDTGYVWNISTNATLTVTWITNGGDPTNARFVLVNPAIYPPYDIQLNDDVAISDGQFVVKNINPPAGYYRFEFQQIGTNRTVLSESGTFNITGGTGNTPSSTSSTIAATGNGNGETTQAATSTPGSSSTNTVTGSSSVATTQNKSSKDVAIGAGVGVPVGLILLAGISWLVWRLKKSRPPQSSGKKNGETGHETREYKAELAASGNEEGNTRKSVERKGLQELDIVETHTRPQELSGQKDQPKELTSPVEPQELPA